MLSRVAAFAVGFAVPLLLVAPAAANPAQEGFAILKSKCFQCHGGAVALSGLRLDSREAALKGGSRGAAVDLVSPASSRLLQMVTNAAEPLMPPTGALPETDIEKLRRWLESGFEWPGGPREAEPEWWAFRAPSRPALPEGAKNPVNAFIAAKLREQKLPAAPEANRLTLLRRATFDLHGLPPSPEEVDQFLSDQAPDAWEKLIDRLLESPRYGEKWGRHWLDLVRYGDTAGFETDPYHLDAWRFRDYVIQAFNQDKPFDQFLKEQLAGDELWPEDPDAVTATGYFRVGPHRDLQVKVEEENRAEKLFDYVDTTSRVFMGLTVGCARCHDHKFDPIPQRDYHRLQAIFEPAVNARPMLQPLALLSDVNATKREFQLFQIGEQLGALFRPYERKLRQEKLAAYPPEVLKAFETSADDRTPQQQVLVTEYGKQARVSDDEVLAAMTPEDRERVEAVSRRLVSIFRGYSPPPFTSGIADATSVFPPSFIALRGNPKTPGDEVSPGFLSILGGGDVPAAGPRDKSTGRRRALAEWLADPHHPLTARVMANRIWQYHFGEGLLETSSDFGVRAGQPSHPELLDWLATEFVAKGWSVKAMHRIIMNTDAYRRSSIPTAEARAKDPRNRYLSHMSRRRLTAEEVRDAVLSVSGEINLKMGGIPVVPPLDEEELYGIIGNTAQAWPVTPDPRQHTRRSVYLLSRRTFIQPMFAAFDHPDGISSCNRRNESTTAPQSLTLLNSRFMIDQAEALAKRFTTVEDAWKRVLHRDPLPQEKAWAEEFIAQQTATQGSPELARAELARALLNLNEFLYVD
jgi:mono/diheme cytochrome c family protein